MRLVDDYNLIRSQNYTHNNNKSNMDKNQFLYSATNYTSHNNTSLLKKSTSSSIIANNYYYPKNSNYHHHQNIYYIDDENNSQSKYNSHNQATNKLAEDSSTYEQIYSYKPRKVTSPSPTKFLYSSSTPENYYCQENYGDYEDEHVLIKIDPSLRQKTQSAATATHAISNDETRRLSGLVAKTRAFFEVNNNKNTSSLSLNRSTTNLKTSSQPQIKESISINSFSTNSKPNKNTSLNNNNKSIIKSSSIHDSLLQTARESNKENIFLNSNKNNNNFGVASNTVNSLRKEFNSMANNTNNNQIRPKSYSNLSNSVYKIIANKYSNAHEHDNDVDFSYSQTCQLPKSFTSFDLKSNDELDIPKSVKEAKSKFENLSKMKSSASSTSGLSKLNASKSQQTLSTSQNFNSTIDDNTLSEESTLKVILQSYFLFKDILLIGFLNRLYSLPRFQNLTLSLLFMMLLF
jgi:hypothetical protein